METCANHCCAKETERKNMLTCALCRDPLYCSQKCVAMDWVKHACPNTIDTPHPEQTLFVPYHYEDLLGAEEIAELDICSPIFQQYSLQNVSSNMKVQGRIQPSLVAPMSIEGAGISFFSQESSAPRGADPVDDKLFSGKTSFIIYTDFGKEKNVPYLTGMLPGDLIYKGNTNNKKANILAGGKTDAQTSGSLWNRFKARAGGLARQTNKASEKYVFWPNPQMVYDLNVRVPMAGEARISLQLGEKSKSAIFVSGGYVLNRSTDNSRLSKSIRKLFDLQLQTKLRGVMSSTKNLQSMQATDINGNMVVLTVLVEEGANEGQLVDIEFIAPRSQLSMMKEDSQDAFDIESSVSFTCNPEKLEDLVGLHMGLQYLAVQEPEKAKELERVSSIIEEYTRQKLKNPDSTVLTAKVTTAVNSAVDTLHAHYETLDKPLFARARKWFRGVRGSESLLAKTNKFTTEEEFQTMYNDQIAKAQKAQASGRSGENFVANAEAVASIAEKETKKRPSFVVTATPGLLQQLKKKAQEIKKTRKAKGEKDEEY